MPKFRWAVTFAGELEAENEAIVRNTLQGQFTVAMNLLPVLKAVNINIEPESGIVRPDPPPIRFDAPLGGNRNEH